MGLKPYFFSHSFLDFPTHFWIIVFYWILEGVQYKTPKIIEQYLRKMYTLPSEHTSIKLLND